MRSQVESIIDELKQLRSEGVDGVYIEDATLKRLRGMAGSAPTAVVDAPETKAVQPEKREPQPNLIAEWNSTVAEDKPAPKKPVSKPAAKKSAMPEGIAPIPEPVPFTLPEGDKQARWDWLREKVLNDPVCIEHAHLDRGNKVVLGVGDLDADIFFCGEAPGADEALQGEPFVGKAGQLLNKIITAMSLKREKVYIGNIMNWRPEHDKPYGDRPPEPEEMAYCFPHLEAQVEIVKPKVIVALGATATQGLLKTEDKPVIKNMRGKWHDYNGTPLIVTYHPSFLLRNASDKSKRLVWEDMLRVMEKIGLPISEKQKGYFLSKG